MRARAAAVRRLAVPDDGAPPQRCVMPGRIPSLRIALDESRHITISDSVVATWPTSDKLTLGHLLKFDLKQVPIRR